MRSGHASWPARPGRTRRAVILIALGLAAVTATACSRSIELPPSGVVAAPSPASPSVGPTPAPATTTQLPPSFGLAEEPTRRDVGLPASVAAVFIVGVAWGLVRLRRLAPVDERPKPSAGRRTVAR